MLDLVRGLVRPSLTWGGFATVSALLLYGGLQKPQPEWFKEILTWYLGALGPILGFWYATRENRNNGGPGTPQ